MSEEEQKDQPKKGKKLPVNQEFLMASGLFGPFMAEMLKALGYDTISDKKQKKVKKSKPYRPERQDLIQVGISFIFGGIAVATAIYLIPLYGNFAIIGGILGVASNLIRAGLYFNSYARYKNVSEKGNFLTKSFEATWNHLPILPIFSKWKVENDMRQRELMSHLDVLDKRVEKAAEQNDSDRREAAEKDRKVYAHIVNGINPNMHLSVIAQGWLSVIFTLKMLGRYVMQEQDTSLLVMGAIGLIISLRILPIHLSLYAQKKAANNAEHPLFSKYGAMVNKTPLSYLTRFNLRRSLRKIDKIEISDDLKKDLKDLKLDDVLAELISNGDFDAKNSLEYIPPKRKALKPISGLSPAET